jgi:hypothetical protein
VRPDAATRGTHRCRNRPVRVPERRYPADCGSGRRGRPRSLARPGTLRAALQASEWPEREQHPTAALETIAVRFNALGLTEPLEPAVRPFYNRPFLVLDSDRFAEACMAETPLRDLGLVGSIDQFVDSTDVLSYPPRVEQLAESIWP